MKYCIDVTMNSWGSQEFLVGGKRTVHRASHFLHGHLKKLALSLHKHLQNMLHFNCWKNLLWLSMPSALNYQSRRSGRTRNSSKEFIIYHRSKFGYFFRWRVSNWWYFTANNKNFKKWIESNTGRGVRHKIHCVVWKDIFKT